MDQATLRDLLLGAQFQPKIEDIPTPQLLLDKGVPDGLLRLVSMSAEKRGILTDAMGTDSMLNSALLVASTLRMRDGGGEDSRGTPVMSTIDAKALIEQDYDLLGGLAAVVKPFLGIDVPIAQAVAAAKNDSGATPSSESGTVSPSSSDSPPSEPVAEA